MRSSAGGSDHGQVYEPLRAFLDVGIRFRPERVRLVDQPEFTWSVLKVLEEQHGGGPEDDPIDTLYRLRVIGPVPGSPDELGEFVMEAVTYMHGPYWWVRPVDPQEPSG